MYKEINMNLSSELQLALLSEFSKINQHHLTSQIWEINSIMLYASVFFMLKCTAFFEQHSRICVKSCYIQPGIWNISQSTAVFS